MDVSLGDEALRMMDNSKTVVRKVRNLSSPFVKRVETVLYSLLTKMFNFLVQKETIRRRWTTYIKDKLYKNIMTDEYDSR